jgi:hypothetical protein
MNAQLLAISPVGRQIFDTGREFRVYTPEGELKDVIDKASNPNFAVAAILKWNFYSPDDPLGQEMIRKYGIVDCPLDGE